MKCLFFDVETNALPKKYDAAYNDLNNWPRIVQIAWGCARNKDECDNIKSFIIKPLDFKIGKDTSDIHGITQEYALENGVGLKGVLEEFENDLKDCRCIVAHNIDFDLPTVCAEMMRNDVETEILTKIPMCTMKNDAVIKFCDIKMWGSYDELKWPKLIELHKKLFGVEFDGQHDAKEDIAACMRCYFELIEKGIIMV